MKLLPRLFRAVLRTSGIESDGLRPWDMKVHDRSAFSDILRRGTVGLGESYITGKWIATISMCSSKSSSRTTVTGCSGCTPGQDLIDIGCGFGTCASYLAGRFSVNIFGVTVSKEQAQWYRQRIAHPKVSVEVMDYRELLSSQYAHAADRVYSVGMFEHVEARHHREFMKVVD